MADDREKTIASRVFFAAIRPLFGGALDVLSGTSSTWAEVEFL